MHEELKLKTLKHRLMIALVAGAALLSPILPISVSSIHAAPALTPSTQTVNAIAGAAITPTTAFTVTEVPGSKTFSITPALPTGLALNTTTGVVSGTPLSTLSATTYTITVSDGTASATATVSITVTSASVPATAVSPASQVLVGFVGVEVAPTTAITAPAVTGTKTFAVAPALPAGLSLNTATGVISGTATQVKAATTHVITVSDGSNFGISTIAVTINASGQLLPATQTVIGRVGTALAATSALTSTTLGASRTFSVSPSLPAGLSLNSATGVISGTPTAVAPTTTYTITASDGTNRATAVVVLSVTVTGLPASAGLNSARPGCRPVSFAGNINKTIQAVDNELPSLNFACSVHLAVRPGAITAAVSSLGLLANPEVARYAMTARRVGAGSVNKTAVVKSAAQVFRRQFRPLRPGTWVVTVTAIAPNGSTVGVWTSDAFVVN